MILKAGYLAQVLKETVADALGNEGGQFLVAETQPAALSDAVGLVLELFGRYCVLIPEQIALK